MSLKKIAVIALVILGFVADFTAVLTAQRNRIRPPQPALAAFSPIEGKLDIRAIADIRVGRTRILLCGVAFAKPLSMKALVTEAARRDFQGEAVVCRRIGAGTPCDGRMAAGLGAFVVVQCVTDGGNDLAAEFSDRGFLCDVPAQSGGRYKACPRV